MSVQNLLFADATSSVEEADFVIFGVPYDRTTSYRPGARFAPNAIRQASYNFEAWMDEHGASLSDLRMADAGDLGEMGDPDDMVREVHAFARDFTAQGKFTILLGGEHSAAPPHVRAQRQVDGVVSIDAHLDFRQSYLGWLNSHACSTRRISEIVGVDRVLPVGVRSVSAEEKADAEKLGLHYITAYRIHDEGFDIVLNELRELSWERIYLTLDIDGIDPAYAPGTGTPEPFGLTPYEVKEVITTLADRLIGFDVSEVSPPWDQGQTAALAARLVREVIMTVARTR